MCSGQEDRLRELARRAGVEGLDPRAIVVVVLLAAVVLVWAGWRWLAPAGPEIPTVEPPVQGRETAAPGQAEGGPSGSPEPTMAVVHVVGAVRRPGVYRVPAGARVNDALLEAGGALGSAELSAVNLARTVADGEQILVPKKGEVGDTGVAGAAVVPNGASAGGAGAGPGVGKVNLNTATESDLDTLPGVGPSTAKRIVEDRTVNGPFRAVEDLMRVPGIGPKKFDALKDLVTV